MHERVRPEHSIAGALRRAIDLKRAVILITPTFLHDKELQP